MIGAAKLKVYTKKLANGPRRKSKSYNKPQLFKREFEFQGSQYDFMIRLVFDSWSWTESVQTNRLTMISLRCRRPRHSEFIHFLELNKCLQKASRGTPRQSSKTKASTQKCTGTVRWCVEHVWLLSVCHLSLWVGSSGKTGHGVIAGDPTRRAIGQAR